MPLYRRLIIVGGVCTALGAIYTTYSLAKTKSVETFGQWPYANRQELLETRALAQSAQQRLDTSERIQIQREIIKIEEEGRRRQLTPAEKNYLQDLRDRLRELEARKR